MMPSMPNTVNVNCPRCAEPVACTLALATATGDDGLAIDVSVPDLAQRMAKHYSDVHPDQYAEVIANDA